MEMNNFTQHSFERLKKNGFGAILYALLAEGLLYGYLGFIALFTAETLLPTFITVRLSLTKFLFILVVLSFLLALLGRFLDIRYTKKVLKYDALFFLGLLWSIGILTISLYKFPLVLIPVIEGALFLIGFLFFKIFFDTK